ncbi:Hypothetical predicted protein [Mytilus galloprovincialis]|uniref:Uncharacterized protein n=1 Tax=Mytilus galloprovincialis TaxID=29158 RepID=A0A8B6BF33_MYTGA|nr:Hypothetical predicted protein [Mytilus galloprovincialis]
MAEASAGEKRSPRKVQPVSGLKKSPSYREAQELLEQHIKRQKLLKKYSGQSPIQSTHDVRKEAEKILNEFLKRQLRNDNNQAPVLSQHYQKVVVEDEYDRTERFDDEYIMKGENFSGDEMPGAYASVDGIDDIPYIDGVEENDGRSRSLPSSIQLSVKRPNNIPVTPLLSPHDVVIHSNNRVECRTNADEVSPSISSHSKSPSPRQSKSDDVKPTEPIVKERKRFKSGSLSSEDTESGSVISPDRKKKSVIKRIQERIARAVSRDREKQDNNGTGSPKVSKKPKKRKARSKKRTDKHNDDVDILKEKHTHREGHVEQHHCGENKDIILRTDETWESTDITDFEKSQSQHLDKHRKVKESTDLSGSSEKGFFNAIRRMTSKKGKKNKSSNMSKASIKSSQSAIIQEPTGGKTTVNYDRILSLPSGSHDLNLHLTETTTQTNKGRYRQTTKAITSPRSHDKQQGAQGLPKMGPIHEKSRSEPVQPTVPMITNGHDPVPNTIPHGFTFRQVSREDDVRLPQNQSFNINYSIDERERTIRTQNGDVVVESDVHRSSLEPNDVEVDGSGMSVAAGGRSPPRSIPKEGTLQEESDIDDEDPWISLVAQRIAEMGDSYISGASQVGSPVSNPDERDGEGMTELQRRLRDSFRDFGDTVNETLSLSVEPQQAALNIARQVTYTKFKDTIQDLVGDNIGWQQLAMVFYVTKKATQLAGAGGAVASQLKENCLQYVEDHFASWILNQGGWVSIIPSSI